MKTFKLLFFDSISIAPTLLIGEFSLVGPAKIVSFSQPFSKKGLRFVFALLVPELRRFEFVFSFFLGRVCYCSHCSAIVPFWVPISWNGFLCLLCFNFSFFIPMKASSL